VHRDGREGGGVVTEPTLVRAVREIEAHVAGLGWDRPASLFALVDTAELLAQQPDLADALGLGGDAEGLTPIEQEALAPEESLEAVLERIVWPPTVTGAAAVVERLVLPPAADGDIPEDPAAAEEFARTHPDRQEVRIVAAATRAGASYCALRLRAHDEDASVVFGDDLVPSLLEALHQTLESDEETEA
jgi:hypothetical protein